MSLFAGRVVRRQQLHPRREDDTTSMTGVAKMETDDDKPTIKVNKRHSIPDESIQMPWVEKYRPAKLEDLVAHEDIVSILTKLIDNDNLPHLLLYGPPGTGKVSGIAGSEARISVWVVLVYVMCTHVSARDTNARGPIHSLNATNTNSSPSHRHRP